MSDSLQPHGLTVYSMPSFSVLHYLLEIAQTHVPWVSDAIQPPHPLSLPAWFKLVKFSRSWVWLLFCCEGGIRRQSLVPEDLLQEYRSLPFPELSDKRGDAGFKFETPGKQRVPCSIWDMLILESHWWCIWNSDVTGHPFSLLNLATLRY